MAGLIWEVPAGGWNTGGGGKVAASPIGAADSSATGGPDGMLPRGLGRAMGVMLVSVTLGPRTTPGAAAPPTLGR